jgi:probable F420-dependent oxidoreductase
MQIGIGLPVSGAWATPANLAGFTERAEALGYNAVWAFHRLLVAEGQDLDPVYRSVLDPFVALSFAAARSSRIRLGVAVVNLPFVSPTYLAKQGATLDVLSGGRLDVGLGTGWAPVEFTATGATPERRGARTEEYLAVLRTLWNDDVSSFTGEFYTVPPARMYPKPARRPGPPVLLGGSAPAALRRAGRIADGWISRSAQDLSTIADDIAVVRGAAAAAGRDPAAVRIICRGVLRPGERSTLLSGTPDQVRADVEWLGTQGVTEVFYDLNWDPRIGSPDADPTRATELADELLHALAPRS